MEKDYIDSFIKTYYIANGDCDIQKIKSSLEKEKVTIEEKALVGRIKKAEKWISKNSLKLK
jgi:hypothetical protein